MFHKPLFCNTAKHRINIPKMLLNANIKVTNGITIKCGMPGCKGKVKFYPILNEENNGKEIQVSTQKLMPKEN